MRTLLLLALPLALAGCGKDDSKPAIDHSAMPAQGGTDLARDRVCKMMVDTAKSKRETHEGAEYFFCSESCLEKFKADPKNLRLPRHQARLRLRPLRRQGALRLREVKDQASGRRSCRPNRLGENANRGIYFQCGPRATGAAGATGTRAHLWDWADR